MASWADGAVNELIASAGGDYTTLSAFEGAHDGESPTNATNCQARIKGAIGTSVYWAGWQAGMDDDTRIVVIAESGCECDGTDGAGNDAVLTALQYLNETTNPLWIDYRNLEFNGSYMYIAADGGGEARIAKCMFRDHAGNGILVQGLSADYSIKIGACLFKDVGTNNYERGVDINDGSITTTVYIFHCTAVGATGAASGGFREGSTSTVQCMNCAASNNTTDFSGVSETTTKSEDDGDITHNDADDFTAPSTDDYTVYNTNSNLYHAGTAITDAWFTSLCATDMKGTSWAAPNPSVGCFEYVGAGPGVAPTGVFYGPFYGPLGGPI